MSSLSGEGKPFDPTSEPQTLDIIDERALDRECLAQSLIAHGLDMDVVLFSSIEMWKTSHTRRSSGVLINLGSRDLTEEGLAEEIRALVHGFPELPVIILSDNHELRQVLAALELGVKGYIPSAVGLTVCVEAITLALKGGMFVSTESLPELQRLLAVAGQQQRRRAELFTAREEDVIDALRLGKANKIIAYELNLRESTVKVHVRNIMKKLGARNRTEVIFKINRLFD
ncbi:MAG: response regulator transcription factor [Shinella sp.]|nr:response regulator transcription factor [Shinella sp.]